MKTKSTRRLLCVLAICGFAGGLAVAMPPPVLADGASSTAALIKDRREKMKELGQHMRVIVAFVKGGETPNGEVADRAAKIKSISDKLAVMFPKGTSMDDRAGHPTGAKAEIWKDWTGFEQVIGLMSNAADKLRLAASDNDKHAVRRHFFAIGKNACSGCHKSYRHKLPDSE